MSRATSIRLACVLFAVSGFAALVYQVVWQRVLGIFSGIHTYSLTLIVTAFMAGLGFGGLVGGRWADRLSRRGALLAFAACELAIGVFAVASPWLYYDVAYLELGFLVRYQAALPLVHFAMLLLPTFLMGASLPLLSRGLIDDIDRAARTIGLLYGVNTLGAAFGALASAWVLIGSFGLAGSVRLASIANFAAGAGAVAIWAALGARSDRAARRDPIANEPGAVAGTSMPNEVVTPVGERALHRWMRLSALSGFVALSLQVLWLRILGTAIKSGPYTFGHLLGIFLFFLALGSLAGAFTIERFKRPDLVFLWGQLGIAISGGGAIALLANLPADLAPIASIHGYLGSDDGIHFDRILAAWSDAAAREHGLDSGTLAIHLGLPLAVLAAPTFLMGLTYVHLQRMVQTELALVGRRIGALQTANIVGSMAGTLLTGSLLLGRLGTPGALKLVIVIASVFGILAALRSARPRVAVAAVLAVTFATAMALPGRDRFWSRLHGVAQGDLIVAEDPTAVVALERRDSGVRLLRVNGWGMSILPYSGVHTMLGLVPALLHPAPRDVLLIGLGTGNTAWAVAAAPEVARIDVYEIAKPQVDVLTRAQTQWSPNHALSRLLDDKRVHLTFGDGRLAMRQWDRKYDLIEADALEPHAAYSGNLYSREFFELIRSKLEPGGYLCTYAPTARVQRTVAAVFPHVIAIDSGRDPFLIASDAPVEFSRERLLRRLGDPRVQRYLRSSGTLAQTTSEVRSLAESASVTVPTTGPVQDLDTDLFPRDEYPSVFDALSRSRQPAQRASIP